MKVLYIIFLISFCISSNQYNSKRLLQQKSSLNYSTNLGYFRDLTRKEIISYYNTTAYKKGLKKENLLNFLQDKISNNHKKIEYKDAWKTNWQYFTLLDRDWDYDPLTQDEIDKTTPEKIGWKTQNVYCLPLYTDRLVFINGTKTLVDREHVWPTSKGFKIKNNSDKNNNPQPYAATDMHNLHMGDKHNNQNGHNNLPFGNVLDKSSANQITSSTTGEVTGYVGLNKYGIKVYEPRDIDKGDIARTLFYMATRYHTFKSIDNYEPALKLVTNFNDNKEVDRTISVEETQYNPAAYGILENLLEWNKMDPVSEHEIHRNNLCHKIVQGNRNPYIDFPEWADIAFGKGNLGIDLSNDNGIEKIENKEPIRIQEKNIIPISEIFNSSRDTNFLYVSESLNDSIHIFFKLEGNYHHYIYGREEEFISEAEARRASIVKLEYFKSDKEYLMVYKPYILSPSMYYINEEEDIKLDLGGNDNFIILKNKDFIVTHNAASLRHLKYYLKLTYYSYPPPQRKISPTFSLDDLFISRYEMVETLEAILFFIILDEGAIGKPLVVYAFDKEAKTFNLTKSLSNAIYGLTLINLNEDFDNFIYCTSKMADEPKCFPAKYKDKQLISGSPINVFGWYITLPHDFSIIKNYALLSEQKVAIISIYSNVVYLTIFQYKDEKLILGDITNLKILEYPSYYSPSLPFLMYYINKGLVLYNIIEDSKNKKVAVYKSYFGESCSSFEITTNLNSKTPIFFSDYITGEDSISNFMITEIPILKIILFCDNKEIKPGNTIYNSSNLFHFIVPFSEDPVIIKFKNVKSSYSCNAVINIFHYLIEIGEKSYKCNISPEKDIVNNITDIDLNKTYDMNIEQKVYFNAKFNYPVEKEELIYRYSNTNFGCNTYIFNDKEINCKVPIDFELFSPSALKYEYDIYSKLSCLNDIYVGSIIFKDPYIIETFDADNLEEISQNIDKNFDASEKIERFSVDMINYYYWFTCFGYCDDYYIESGECCKEQILDEWEILSHKEYIWSFNDFLKMLDISIPVIESLKNDFFNSFEIDVTDLIDLISEELFKVYFYNFSILKSRKNKKYIFAFPGTTTKLLLFAEVYLSHKVKFENETDIEVHELFYIIFNQIKNDVFSEEILDDIKKNKDYQIIFTGHSLGGAISTLASYYFAKYNLAENEPVLITFGQPRVGNENFSRDYMSIISNVYRIERYQDIVAMIPPRKKIEEWESVKMIKFVMDIISFVISLIVAAKPFLPEKLLAVAGVQKALYITEKIDSFFKSETLGYIKDLILDKIIAKYPYGYCHIGGLYVLNEESNKFYHCKDIYNQDIKSPYCQNWGIKFGKVHKIKQYLNNHHYLTMHQRPMERCQESKDIRTFI